MLKLFQIICLTIKLLMFSINRGAGGGSGFFYNRRGGSGGGGAFIEAIIHVEPYEVLEVVVGRLYQV